MRFYRFVPATLAAVALAACSEGATAPTGTASVRVLYTSSTAGAASLRIDNATTLRPLTLFDTASTTAVFQVTPGVRQFRVYGGADTTATVRANVSLTIRENERYTIVVRGNLLAPPAAQTLLTTVVQNLDFNFPAGTGQPGVGAGVTPLPSNPAALRVIHAAGNANGLAPISNTVWGWVYPQGTARPTTATVASVGVTAAPTDWFFLSAGTYTVDIGSSAVPAVVRGTANLTLAAGDITTVVVGDAATLPGVRFVVLNDKR
jgi:uncharacterized cupin superfamily protein